MNKEDWLESYWDKLAYAEAAALDESFESLESWNSVVKKCLTLSIEAPFLKGNNSSSISSKLSSAFLKRTMSDFRATWLALNWGYPYQAACIAASLYENSLVVNCITGRDDLAGKIANSSNGDIPWGAQKLAKMAAQKDLYGSISNREPKDQKYQQAWKLCYHNYKLLCKMKHPTLQQIDDEVKNTVTPSGEFAVVPLPDNRESNLGLKQLIIIISVKHLFSSTKNFVKALDCDDTDNEYIEYYNKLLVLYEEIKATMSSCKLHDVPIKAYGYKFQ